MKKFLVSIIFSLSVMSCEDVGDDLGFQPYAVTDRVSYAAGEPITVTIGSNRHIGVLDCCGGLPFYLDRLVQDDWTQHSYFGIICPLVCPSMYHGIGPEEVYTAATVLSDNPEPGTYRLRIPYSDGRASPEGPQVLTNPFTVR